MNKTTDGRLIEKRVKIPKEMLRKLIFEIKKNHNYTWEDLAKKLRLSKQTIRVDWFKENRCIPLSKFKKLISLSDSFSKNNFDGKIKILDPFWGQRLDKKKIFKKGINFPKTNSKEFAEFYGVMLGDGCIYKNLSGFCITGNKRLEKEYYEIFIASVIKKLFAVSPSITISNKDNVIRCYLYSKKISEFLINLGFPPGKKRNLVIPKFLEKRELVIPCLRGLFDTDGSLSRHPHSKIMIHLSITQDTLKDSVKNALIKLNISHSYSKKAIFMYNKNAIEFMEKIGSSNSKNIYKYERFKKTGIVPSSKKTESFLMKNK